MTFRYLTSNIVKSLIEGSCPHALLECFVQQKAQSLREASEIQLNLKIMACFFREAPAGSQEEPLYGRVKALLTEVDSSIWDRPKEISIHVEEVMHPSSSWLDVDPLDGQDLEKQVKKMHGKDEKAMAWLLAQKPMPLNLWESVLHRASQWSAEDRVWLLKACERVNHSEGQSLRHYITLLIQTEGYSKRKSILVKELSKNSLQSLMSLLPCLSDQILDVEVLVVLDKRMEGASGKVRYALMETLFKQDEMWWPWEELQKSLIETPREVPLSMLQDLKKSLSKKTFLPIFLSFFADAVIQKGQSLSRKSLLELLNGIKNNEIIEKAFQCLQGKQVLDKGQIRELLLTTVELKEPGSRLLNLVSEWLKNSICKDFFDEVYPLFLIKLFEYLSESPDYLICSKEMERLLPKEIGRMEEYAKSLLPDQFGHDPQRISPQVIINASFETLRILLSANDKNRNIKNALKDWKPLNEPEGVLLYLRNKQEKMKFLETLLKVLPKDPHVQTFFSLYARMLFLQWIKQRVIPHENNLLNFRVSVLPVYPLSSLGLLQKIGFYLGYKIEKKVDLRWKQTQNVNIFLMSLFVEVVGSSKSGKYDQETVNMIQVVVVALLECKAFHGILIANWTVNHYASFLPESKLHAIRSSIRSACRKVLTNVWHDNQLIEKYCALDPIFAEERRYLESQLQ